MNPHNRCGLCRIDISHLSVQSGADILIEDINLSLHCGELTALIGKNGAGKSTLLKAIIGERPYRGSITYLKHDNGQYKRPLTGYVPQYLDFDKSTPVSVIDFMTASIRKRPVWLGHSKKTIQQTIRRLEELECAHVAQRRLGELSGGELQKVLLATAIEPMPDLLILDEPVSGVDMSGLDIFYKMVTRLRDQYHIAIILVSHDLALIKKYADKVILIDKTVAAQGDIEDVFASDAFRSIFGYME